jgi:hypothetical protein
MKPRILSQIISFLAIAILSCTQPPRKTIEIKTGVTSEAAKSAAITSDSAKSIAIKYLKTIMDSSEFLPESTTVNTWAVNPDYWSVYIKKSNREIPPEYLISVHKTTGKPNFEPLD